jgi:hypothetical protein
MGIVQEKGKMMRGRTVGCIAAFIGALLTTQLSAYANHFIAGGGKYAIIATTGETSVRFQFLGVVSILPDMIVPVIETELQSVIVHPGEIAPFRLFTSSTELDPFNVVADPVNGHIITITGNLLSRLVLGVEPDHQQITEIVHFDATGIDKAIPGAGIDSFTLAIQYSATQGAGPVLSQSLGPELVTCDTVTCTLTVTGTLAEGEIESHTAGGE